MDKSYNIVRQWNAVRPVNRPPSLNLSEEFDAVGRCWRVLYISECSLICVLQNTGDITNGKGQACNLAAADSLKALGLPLILPEDVGENSLHLPLSKHLGIRLSLCQPKDSDGPRLEIFVKVAGLRVRLERGPANTIESAVMDPAGGLFDP